MKKIVQIEDKIEDGLYTRHIFGLNIFAANKVPTEKQIEVEFIRFVSQQVITSGHTGMLLDFAGSPKELFGNPDGQTPYEEVNVGASRGSFYRREDWPYFPPCFFPRLTKDFWALAKPDMGFTWRKVLSYDAIAFYIEPLEIDFPTQINSLFARPFVSNEQWIKDILEIYRLIVSPVGDMNYFVAYANNSADFEILSEPLRTTEKLILEHDWYKANVEKLVWDGERSMCLKLPR